MKSYVKKLWSPLLFLVLGYLGVALMIWYTGEKAENNSGAEAEELVIVEPKAEYMPAPPKAKTEHKKLVQQQLPAPSTKPALHIPTNVKGPLAEKSGLDKPAKPVHSPQTEPDQTRVVTIKQRQDTTSAAPEKLAVVGTVPARPTKSDTVQNENIAVNIAVRDSSIKTAAMLTDSVKSNERPAPKVTQQQMHEQRLSLDQEKIYDDVLNMLRQKLAEAQSKEQPQREPQVAAAGEVVLASNMNVVPIMTSKPAAAIFRRHGLRVAAANAQSLSAQMRGGLGGKVGYMFRDNAKISMNVDLGVSPLLLNKKPVSMLTGDLYAQLHFRNSSRLQPTFSLGFGANRLQAGAFSRPQVVGSVCAGGGMDYKLSDQVKLNSSIQYRQLLNEIKVASSGQRDSFISLQVGLTILFGGGHDSTLSIDDSLMANNK
jgi:outer membrane protein W